MKNKADIEIKRIKVPAGARKLDQKWTIEPVQEMRTGPETLWERLVSRIYYWIGRPCPYTDIMHGLDLEKEMVDALIKEINDNKNQQ